MTNLPPSSMPTTPPILALPAPGIFATTSTKSPCSSRITTPTLFYPTPLHPIHHLCHHHPPLHHHHHRAFPLKMAATKQRVLSLLLPSPTSQAPSLAKSNPGSEFMLLMAHGFPSPHILLNSKCPHILSGVASSSPTTTPLRSSLCKDQPISPFLCTRPSTPLSGRTVSVSFPLTLPHPPPYFPHKPTIAPKTTRALATCIYSPAHSTILP